jgi:hypothetical protein
MVKPKYIGSTTKPWYIEFSNLQDSRCLGLDSWLKLSILGLITCQTHGALVNSRLNSSIPGLSTCMTYGSLGSAHDRTQVCWIQQIIKHIVPWTQLMTKLKYIRSNNLTNSYNWTQIYQVSIVPWAQLTVESKYIEHDVLWNPCLIGLSPYYRFEFFQSTQVFE